MVLRQSAQADIVCVAAISNRQVLLQKRDAPRYNKLSKRALSSESYSKNLEAASFW